MITVKNLSKYYEDTCVFENVNLEVKDGEVLGIIGESGSGKSTLLRCLLLLEKPNSGSIVIDGQEVTRSTGNLEKIRKNVGMVFQKSNLFKHMSVVENVMSGMIHLQGYTPQKAFEEAMSLLQRFGMAQRAFSYPELLSAGQQQRVAIARTVAMKPEIMLMDDPTSSVDTAMAQEIEAVMRMVLPEIRSGIIVSNDMHMIRNLCNRVIFFCDKGIFEEGSTEKIFEHPQNARTRRFIQALNVLEFPVDSDDFDFLDMNTQILEYSFRYGMDHDLVEHLLASIEELCQMAIISAGKTEKMKLSIEYNPSLKNVMIEAKFTGEPFDPENPRYYLSWPLLKRNASSIRYETFADKEYPNQLYIQIV